MKLYKVPMLNDYPDFRGNFITSTVSKQVAYLAGNGGFYLLNTEVGDAIRCLFDIIADRPAKPIPTIGIDHFSSIQDRMVSVSAVERLAKVFKSEK